jgi:hypothetical protein
MSERDDGGPAFPRQSGTLDMGGAQGMSLRDWFAGQALVGLANRGQTVEEIATYAYELADAMLEVRKS